MRIHIPRLVAVSVTACALVLGSTAAAAASPLVAPAVTPATQPQSPATDSPTATDTTNDSDGIDGVGADPNARSQAALAPAAETPVAKTFVSPLKAKSYYVSSYFGGRCIVLPGSSTMHLGIDLAAPGGTPIYAVAAGRVTHTVDGTASVAGYITIEHRVGAEIYQSRYLHMWSARTHVKVGDIVKAGQQISVVGTSGGSTGNHLHLEWWKGPWGAASAMEPAAYLKGKSVDLLAGAISVTATPTPATCTYYATTGLNFRTGPSTATPIKRLLPQGTKMTHVPGQITSGFIPVTIGADSGWVSSSYVSTKKPPAATPPPAPPTYVTTTGVNMRSRPTVKAVRILIIPKGANLGVVLETKGAYRKFTYAGTTGWVHSSYITQK